RIINSSHRKITVYTDEPCSVTVNRQTAATNKSNKTSFQVLRSSEPLLVTVEMSDLTQTVEVNALNSAAYWCNIVYNAGIGLWLERNNPKRYTYPSRIYINTRDTIIRYYTYQKTHKKGEIYLHTSLPHFNIFEIWPENEGRKTNAGFWGISMGFDYYHRHNQFLNLCATAITDIPIPVPAAVDFYGEHERLSSSYFSLTNNHLFKRLSLGYGLNFGRYAWDRRTYRYDPEESQDTLRAPVTKRHNAIGGIFPAYIKVSRRFQLGLVYKPTFYRFGILPAFTYEHSLSVDLAWKFKIH
ncbi:MAG: hypothetical protein IT269_13225, partial [Saprospiraceae bacterium]|nr:hypothetical protein [Saprospiraceae bacterium]